jgi:hypothetical protein
MDKSKFVAVCLATYADMSVISAALVGAFESANALIKSRVESPRLLETVFYWLVEDKQSEVMEYNSLTMQKVSSMILMDKLKMVELMLTFPESQESMFSSDNSGIFFRSEPDKPNKPLIVKLTIKRQLLSDSSRDDWQDDMIAWGLNWFTRLRCVYGYMTQDCEPLSYAYNDSVYELIQGIGYRYPVPDYRKWLPGYFWGNWLSHKHIEQLGGIERLRHDAPCTHVNNLVNDDGESIFLQLTDSIDDYSDDWLERIRRFLCPVVPRCNELPQHKPNTVRYRIVYADTKLGSSVS